MTYEVHVRILHSPDVCVARRAMCDKLKTILEAAPELRAHVTFVTDHEPHELSALKSLAGLVDVDPANARDVPDLAREVRALHINQLSCALKHAAAIAQIASADRGFHVVLEDDCLFGEDVVSKLLQALRSLPTDYDLAFLGLPAPLSAQDTRPVRAVTLSSVYPILPGCDSYVLNPAAARALLPWVRPVRMTANLQWNYLLRKQPTLKAYLLTPNVFVDGSKLGVYLSQQDSNNRLVWNEAYLKLEKLVAARDLPKSPAELQAAQELVDSLPFKTHPDMLRLLAKLQHRLGNLREAETLFRQAYDITVAEKCVLNSSSQLLRDYMVLHRDLQSDMGSVTSDPVTQ